MDQNFNYCVPCLFGLEGIAADELKRMGMDAVQTENGRVLFAGEKPDIARVNINLRTGERVLLHIGESRADTFDMLFEAVRAMPWENYVPIDGAFPVKGHALDSKLFSVPDCQKIVKKAIVERLKAKYKVGWLEETGAKYQVQFAIMRDTAAIYIDTSGAGLHKRGYRPVANEAPLRETLAAAIVKLSRYRGRDAVCDPFCGSGTIPIEAALIALNRAPGLSRKFAAQDWVWIPKNTWGEIADEARDREFRGKYDIWGGDIDSKNVELSHENARRAGVAEHVRFTQADAAEFHRDDDSGTILTNPPYGERVLEHREAEEIYRRFGAALRPLDTWKMYILSSHTEFERTFGRTATKKRKLYNGMLKCDLFMYY